MAQCQFLAASGMKNLLEFQYFKISAEKRIQTRNWIYQSIVGGKLLVLEKEVRNMILILFAKIIKNGWFDSENDKTMEHREIVPQIINRIIKVVSVRPSNQK